MFEVRQTEVFIEWHAELRDRRAAARISTRIERAQAGNLGDVQPVGEGVSEMRIHYGAGYRLYFVRRGAALIALLCSGDKSTQTADIKQALQMAKEV